MKKIKGFTLIELLVVIGVIALLLSVIVPSLQKAKVAAKEMVCVSNLHQTGLAALAYQMSHERLPMHIVENENFGTNYGWLEQMSDNNSGVDHRQLWVDYISDLNFFNCPLLKELDISIETIPLAEKRVYCGYEFFFGYYRDRNRDGTWAGDDKRWTKTEHRWLYEGRSINVLAADRFYRSETSRYYRINHANGLGLKLNYVDYRTAGRDGKTYCVSVYEQSGLPVEEMDNDKRLKTTASYLFKDGSAEKYKGKDESLMSIYAPPDQDFLKGERLVPFGR